MKRINKGDEVIVTTGRSKGQRGHVLRVVGDSKLLVENVNMVKKHQKPNPAMNQGGGIVVYNPGIGKGDRVSFKTLDDGRKVRIFKSTGEAVDI